jgi:hypothetical protein
VLARCAEKIVHGPLVTVSEIGQKYLLLRTQVGDILKRDEFLFPDASFVLPGEFFNVLAMNKTPYYTYLSDIHEAVLKAAEESRYSRADDSYVGIVVSKIAENADNVMDMSKHPSSLESIYRKSRNLIRVVSGLIRVLDQKAPDPTASVMHSDTSTVVWRSQSTTP